MDLRDSRASRASLLARYGLAVVLAGSVAAVWPTARAQGAELDVPLETPAPPVTGQPFTVRPVFPSGFVFPSTAECVWEFRWGTADALKNNTNDGTFGGMYFKGPAAEYCVEWTFTLPHRPVPQFQVSFSYTPEPFYHSGSGCIGCWDDGWNFIKAAVSSTSPHISSSTIPVGYILPNKDELTLGEAVTYTRYLVNNPYVNDSKTQWDAHSTESETPSYRTQTGGTSFTYTPDRPGEWMTGWGYFVSSATRWTQAYWDPRVKSSGADTTAPAITRPIQRLGTGTLRSTVPVNLSWSGSDSGSGLQRFVLQRSRDGGSWASITLPTALSTSIALQLEKRHTYRFRVRAIDKAGNRSVWAEGPTFKPAVVQESNSNIRYVSTWTTSSTSNASGGAHRLTTSSMARANYTFSGRDIAWVAETGPGRGKVDVYVDNVLVQTVDLYSASAQPRRIVFSRHWSAKGTHTISLRNKGTSGRPQAALDAFLVLR